MEVLARDGSRVLSGRESAAQRLSDALSIALGSYPWSRDYGCGLDALVDLGIDSGFAARAFAEVARVFRHPANGLADLELVEVRVLDVADDRADLLVRARWEGEDLPVRVPAAPGRWLDDGAWLDDGHWLDGAA